MTTTTTPRNLEDLAEILQMYNDVTQRLEQSHERLQQEVVRLREQLEQKNRELEMKKRLAALGEMAAGIAHEIRNPLGGIQLYASTLAGEVSEKPLARELVQKISSGVRGLNTLVTDMLAFAGNMQIDMRGYELEQIVMHAIELAQPSLTQHNVTVTTGEAVGRIMLNVDGRMLERVLLNLLLNASEAIAEENRSQKPEARIIIDAVEQDGAVVITVKDNGPGIAAEVLERLFNPFFTTKHSGTGLGLAIVHRIIEAHNGTITAANNTNEPGAIFTITLVNHKPSNMDV